MTKVTESLKKDLIKAMLLMISLVIGVFCTDKTDTNDSFYIAVFIQSLSNVNDSFDYIGHPYRIITVAYISAALGAVISFIFALMYFMTNTKYIADNTFVVVLVCVFLSIPLIIDGVRIYTAVRSGEY